MADLEQLLTEGLTAGYAGSANQEVVKRGVFQVNSSQFPPNPNSESAYHDEWIAKRTGGGQEIAQLGDQKVTRLYAGGVVSEEALRALGVTEKDVTGYLKSKIQELGNQTRLQEHCAPPADGEWQYSYVVSEHLEDIGLTIGLETIRYRGRRVFAHGFLHSPIE